jgi:hypothetical protein
MTNNINLDALPRECQQALNAYAGQIFGADSAGKADAHLQSCPACRTLLASVTASDASVRAAVSHVRAKPDFLARTMAALPFSAAPASSPAPAQMRVYAAPTQRRFWLRSWSGIAAAVALVALGVVIFASVARGKPALAITVQKGRLVDEKGVAVQKIQAGRVCTAEEDTVMRSAGDDLLKIRKGARFSFQTSETGNPGLKLESGDMYAAASATENENALPVRVGCANFDAELNSGNCFLAQETSSIPQSVMILFDGSARITPLLREPVHLKSGQIFVSVGLAEDAYTDTLELAAFADGAVPESIQNAGDPGGMRALYERQIEGYHAELTALNKRLAALAPEDTAVADLRDRCTRIEGYLRAHESRLNSMPKSNRPLKLPLESIERGLKEHLDPKTWM